MSALVDAVRARTPKQCQARRCKKKGVLAKLDKLPRERVLVDLDCGELKIKPEMKRCDFILACGEHVIAPIELKSGNVELAQIARQLEGGIRIACEWLAQNDSLQVRFRPIVVYRGNFNRHKGKKPAAKIKVGEQVYEIKVIHSGSPLHEALRGA